MLDELHRHEKALMEKHMGCMTGFFQIFDRHHVLATKRLPPPSGNSSPSQSASSAASPPPIQPSATRPAHLPIFDFQDGSRTSWKLKDSPRLSLDSRILDGRGKLHPPPEIRTYATTGSGGSPSVVARLMGLDALPRKGGNAELRRSASESRASRDLRYTFLQDLSKIHDEKPKEVATVAKPMAPAGKSFFHPRDFFPEKTGQRGSLYGEIEKKLRMRGIDEPGKDLETLKQIMEALQLKGLLHSRHDSCVDRRNYVLVDQGDSLRSRFCASSPPPQRNPRSRRDRTGTDLKASNVRKAPDPAVARSPSSPAPRRGLQKVSPVQSPKSTTPGPRRVRMDSTPSPRPRRAAVTANLESLKMEEECSAGRSLLERCDKLLHSIAAITERSDDVEPPLQQKQQPSPMSVLDSSAAFYSDEATSAAASPSSVDSTKGESDEQPWMLAPPPAKLLQPLDAGEAGDCDFICVSSMLGSVTGDEFLLLLHKDIEEVELDLSLKEVPRLHRRLVFDTLAEIVERKRQVSPWEAFSQSQSGCISSELGSSARQVWEELKRLREHVPVNDHHDAARSALQKDTADSRCYWRGRTDEMSGAVLDIERLIFKELIGETIQELSACGSSSNNKPTRSKCRTTPAPVRRRKLVF